METETRTPPLSPAECEEIRQRRQAAFNEVVRLIRGGEFRTSEPPRPDDSDRALCESQNDVDRLLATVEARDREVEALREERDAWKGVAERQQAGNLVLGTRKSRDVAELRQALHHTAGQLRAALAGKPVRDADEVLERARILTGGEPHA